MRAIACKILPPSVRRALRPWFRGGGGGQEAVPASYGYQVLGGGVSPELLRGWQNPVIAERQHAAFAPLLRQMYTGTPREDFLALASAVEMTGLADPLIIEVGCGSGWNFEVLTYLLNRPVRYIGVDYSSPMIALAGRSYPDAAFVVGDAALLPFHDRACDILLSGTVLMHLLDYEQAIRDSLRVTRNWCVFHTVPIMRHRPTTILSKCAYGQPILEIIFNEDELLSRFHEAGLFVRHVLDSLPYDLQSVLGEHTYTRTYVCEIV